ncbi:hypothetical protein [Acetivibrio saccincola]|uniref:ABC-type transport system involved in multi-copper enzyme maturation, permease component n=1 Tax=Acetivibrio saccincola TaxID=1677857 RepID=A0A2S8RAU0_9FIRM|nr:hypothetical protein [Acetivibrio saccincola]PQQ66900.1 hypothetical protein B9R14_09185 [Acetivibrio saccincola]
MSVFIKLLILETKLLIRRYYLIIPFILTFIYLFYGYSNLQDSLDNYLFIRSSGYMFLGVTILSMCIGVINARQERVVKFEELMNTLPSFWIRLITKFFSWSLFSLVYCLILAVLCTIWSVKDVSQLDKYVWQILAYILVNYWLPMMSMWVIAYSIEKAIRPIIGWPLLLIVWYTIQPFNEGSIYNASIMFNQFIEQPYGSPNLLHYGLEMNMGLLARKLWFLMASLSLYIFANLAIINWQLKNSKSKIALTTAVLMVIGALPLAVISSVPHSPAVKWEFDSTLWDKQLIEQAKEEHQPFHINGEIKSLHIDIGGKNDRLEYNAKIQLDNLSKDAIIFTLYRSLEIESIKINGSEKENYIRENDWIILEEHSGGNIEIEMSVSGKLPITLGEVTHRTMLLTPDFPWYPILGKHKVLNPMLTYDYFSNNLVGQTTYDIGIKSRRGDIITNLSYDEGVEFYGKAKGPAIIQGDYKSENIEGIHFVAPTILYYFYKEAITIVPDLIVDYKKEFLEKLNLEIDDEVFNKHNRIFLVNYSFQHRHPFRSIGEEMYTNYLRWQYPSSYDNTFEATKGICENIRVQMLFESFLRNGKITENSVSPYLFETLVYIAESGEKRDIGEYFESWWGEDNERKAIIWENDIDEIKEIEKLIKAQSKEETSDIAYEILKRWITIPKER